MSKEDAKEHQKFFNLFIKWSIITTIAVIVILVGMYIFLV
tara:strand:+ start:273 stop:392 length:120 start_codon:yes stop_codon:yes gene_type:complete